MEEIKERIKSLKEIEKEKLKNSCVKIGNRAKIC